MIIKKLKKYIHIIELINMLMRINFFSFNNLKKKKYTFGNQ